METVTAAPTFRSGVTPNFAQYYDEVVDRHGPLLTAAVGRRLTAVWTPRDGLLARRSAREWGSRSPIVLAFEGLYLEFSWHLDARSVTYAVPDTAIKAEQGRDHDLGSWYELGEDPDDPADLTALVGQRLWAVDALEVDGDRLDLGFAFSRGYLAMTASCCCTLILSCGPQPRRQLRLAMAGPTRDGYPPTAIAAPRTRPAWPPPGTDPSLISTGRPDSAMHTL